MIHQPNIFPSTREQIDPYLTQQEEQFPYHDKAIAEEVINILSLHAPWDYRHADGETIDKETSTYNITNYLGLSKESEYSTDEQLLSILHAEMGRNPKLMEHGDYDLQLTNTGISRINNVFNEMESHYLLYKPKLWTVISHFLRNNNIGQCLTDKRTTINGKSNYQYQGLKLSLSKQQATSQILDFLQALLLLEDDIPTGRKRNNILGHYLQFFRRRMQMDLSDVYQKRNGLFGLIAKNILGCDKRIIYDADSFIVKEIANKTEFQDSQYTLSVNFTILVDEKPILCTLHGRTKNAKSINEKLESNPDYNYIDAMDDLFGYTITTENNEDLGLVTGIFMSQILSKRIGIIENNIDGLKLSSKGGLLDDSMKTNIKDLINHEEKNKLFDSKTTNSKKSMTKKITSQLYQDFKAQLSMTNIDGHECGCEIKFMTSNQFIHSENDDDAGNNVMKIKNKISKDSRYEKILPPQFVAKFIKELKEKETFRGQKINKSKVKQYIKEALYCVSFTYDGKSYYGYIAQDYYEYFKKQQLIGEDITVVDWIDPLTSQ